MFPGVRARMTTRPRLFAPFSYSSHAINDPGSWKSGAGMTGSIIDADLGVFKYGQTGVQHLIQIVGRNIGCHADGNSGRAVDQQVGYLREE